MPGFSRQPVQARRVRRWLVAAALVVAAPACSGDGGDGGEPGGATTGGGGTTTTADPAYAFTLTGTEVQAMTPQPPAFPPDVAARVKAGLDAWLSDGVVEPLRGGTAPAGLEQSFTAGALARLTASATDRAAVLEDGAVPKGRVRQDRANARLTALTGPDGAVVLVTAQVEVAHTVDAGDADVVVVRTGELVMVDDGGAWKVDAFDVRTSRDTQ